MFALLFFFNRFLPGCIKICTLGMTPHLAFIFENFEGKNQILHAQFAWVHKNMHPKFSFLFLLKALH